MKRIRSAWTFVENHLLRWFLIGSSMGILAAVIAWFLAIPISRSTADLKVRVNQQLMGYSPTGRYVATKGYVNPGIAVKVWDASVRGQMPCVLTIPWGDQNNPQSRPDFELVISPDERQIVSEWRWEDATHRRMTIVSLADGSPVISRAVEFSADAKWHPLIWSPDGRWLAATSLDYGGGCYIWDARTLESVLFIPHARQAIFSPDGNRLLTEESPSEDVVDITKGVIAGWSIWSLPSGRRYAFHARPVLGSAGSVCLSRDGQITIRSTLIDAKASVQLYDAVSGHEIAALTDESQPVVSRDGQYMLTRWHLSRNGQGFSLTFQLRDALTGTLRSSAIIPGEWHNVSATDNARRPFQVTSYLRRYNANKTGWSSPSWRGWLWGYHQQICVHDAATGEALGRFDSRETGSWPTVSPDGTNVAWVDKRRDGVFELQIHDLPQRTAWGWIASVGMLSAGIAVIGGELTRRWRGLV